MTLDELGDRLDAARTEFGNCGFIFRLAANGNVLNECTFTGSGEAAATLKKLATEALGHVPDAYLPPQHGSMKPDEAWCYSVIAIDWHRGRRVLGWPYVVFGSGEHSRISMLEHGCPFDIKRLMNQTREFCADGVDYEIQSQIGDVFGTSLRILPLLEVELPSPRLTLVPPYENMVRLIWNLEDMRAAWAAFGVLKGTKAQDFSDFETRRNAVLHLWFVPHRVGLSSDKDALANWRPSKTCIGWGFEAIAAMDSLKTLLLEYYEAMGWEFDVSVIDPKGHFEARIPAKFGPRLEDVIQRLSRAVGRVQGGAG